MSKERSISGIKVVMSGETYDEYKRTLQEQLEEKDEEIERIKELSKVDSQQAQEIIVELKQENERLHSIIKEVREYIEEAQEKDEDKESCSLYIPRLIEILDKGE